MTCQCERNNCSRRYIRNDNRTIWQSTCFIDRICRDSRSLRIYCVFDWDTLFHTHTCTIYRQFNFHILCKSSNSRKIWCSINPSKISFIYIIIRASCHLGDRIFRICSYTLIIRIICFVLSEDIRTVRLKLIYIMNNIYSLAK